jgi:uncharacterized protein (DUF433 family)
MEVDYKAIQEDPALRRGLYGLNELTRYLSFEQSKQLVPSTVARWAHQGLSALEHTTRRSDYSFVDLVSMLVVRNLILQGLSIGDIRRADAHLRERYGHAHPFVSVRLKTDGVDVFYNALPAITDQLTAANRGGQEVIRPAITRALQGVTYEDGLAARWSPTDGIVLDPTVQFGEPCLAETSVTTAHVAELAVETSTSELAQAYRLDEASVIRAINFERQLALST